MIQRPLVSAEVATPARLPFVLQIGHADQVPERNARLRKRRMGKGADEADVESWVKRHGPSGLVGRLGAQV